jgi:hypothetical protein
MVFHGAKCRHCRSNMSEPKLMEEGPKKGWYRSYCISCGHIEFEPPSGGVQRPQQQQSQPRSVGPTPMPTPVPRPAAGGNVFQPILIKRPPSSY